MKLPVFFLLVSVSTLYAQNPLCSLPSKAGPCRGFFKRFFYNPETSKCEGFVYGGCSGNGNNFLTRDRCEQTCKADDTTTEQTTENTVTHIESTKADDTTTTETFEQTTDEYTETNIDSTDSPIPSSKQTTDPVQNQNLTTVKDVLLTAQQTTVKGVEPSTIVTEEKEDVSSNKPDISNNTLRTTTKEDLESTKNANAVKSVNMGSTLETPIKETLPNSSNDNASISSTTLNPASEDTTSDTNPVSNGTNTKEDTATDTPNVKTNPENNHTTNTESTNISDNPIFSSNRITVQTESAMSKHDIDISDDSNTDKTTDRFEEGKMSDNNSNDTSTADSLATQTVPVGTFRSGHGHVPRPFTTLDCSSAPVRGFCRGLFHHFFYNTSSGQCEEFIWGGCGGNGNNYENVDKCRLACIATETDYSPARTTDPPTVPDATDKIDDNSIISSVNPGEPDRNPVTSSGNPVDTEENLGNLAENHVDKGENPENTPENPVNNAENPVNTAENPVNTAENLVNTPENPVNTPENPVNTPVNTPENPVNTPENPVNTAEKPVNTPENPVNTNVNPVTTDKNPDNLNEDTVNVEKSLPHLDDNYSQPGTENTLTHVSLSREDVIKTTTVMDILTDKPEDSSHRNPL